MGDRSRREPFLSDLLIYPTSRCNLKCRHCYFAPSYDEVPGLHSDEVSYEQICQLLEDLLPFGLRACKLSGGEPFLRDDVVDLCRHIDSKGLSVILETNGTLVKRHQADALAQLHNDTFVSVSIDGAAAETHESLRGVKGCFEKALEGLDCLVHAGLNVQVIAAVYEDNKSEVLQLIDLCAAKGVGSFKACFVHAVGRARDLPLIRYTEALDLDRQFSQYARSVGLTYCTSIPVALRSVTDMIQGCALSSRCNITSALAVLSDGMITICGMGRYVREFRFGKLGESDVAEVWMNHPILKHIRESIPSKIGGICGRCIMRSACLGYCRLENEFTTVEDLLKPYVRCAELEALGLFPQSRIVSRCAVAVESAVV